MIDEALLQKLSLLARVQVAPEDIPKRLEDFKSILRCIDEINSIVIPDGFQVQHNIVNHVRPDIVRSASTDTVEGIVANFPDNTLGQLRVQQVLKK